MNSTGSASNVDRIEPLLEIEKLKHLKAFFQDCCEEQVIPHSFPGHLKKNSHPFPESARQAIREAIVRIQNEIDELPELKIALNRKDEKRLQTKVH